MFFTLIQCLTTDNDDNYISSLLWMMFYFSLAIAVTTENNVWILFKEIHRTFVRYKYKIMPVCHIHVTKFWIPAFTDCQRSLVRVVRNALSQLIVWIYKIVPCSTEAVLGFVKM